MIGRSYNGYLIFTIFLWVFALSIFLYHITGGENRNFKEDLNPDNIHKAEPIKTNSLIKNALNPEEEFLYTKYFQQNLGPSLFQSNYWKTLDEKNELLSSKLPVYVSEEGNNEPIQMDTKVEIPSDISKHFSENTFLQLDLDNISEGPVEIPNPKLNNPKNSLEKNINLLLEEQNKILDNSDPLNAKSREVYTPSSPLEDSKNAIVSPPYYQNQKTTPLDFASYHPLLKVVHISDR